MGWRWGPACCPCCWCRVAPQRVPWWLWLWLCCLLACLLPTRCAGCKAQQFVEQNERQVMRLLVLLSLQRARLACCSVNLQSVSMRVAFGARAALVFYRELQAVASFVYACSLRCALQFALSDFMCCALHGYNAMRFSLFLQKQRKAAAKKRKQQAASSNRALACKQEDRVRVWV